MIPSRSQIETGFACGEVRSVVRIGGFDDRDVYLVETADARHVLKSASAWATDELLDCELALLEHLDVRGFHRAPRLRRTRPGSRWIEIDARRWFMISYLDGCAASATPDGFSRLGETLASLHRIDGFGRRTAYTIENLVTHELPKRAEGLPFADEFAAIVAAIAFLPDARRTVIHTDPSPSNSIVLKGGALCLVDWECAGLGNPVIDLGAPLITQFLGTDLEFDRASAVAFYTAYVSAGGTLSGAGDIFAAGVITALNYLRYDIDRNWARVRHALQRRTEIIDLLASDRERRA